jgi:hypothetical protein
MLLCSVPCGKLAATEGDSNPSEPVPTQQRERGGKYPYSIKVVGKGRRHSSCLLLRRTLRELPSAFFGQPNISLGFSPSLFSDYLARAILNIDSADWVP